MKTMLSTGITLLFVCLPAPSQATDQNRPVLDVIVVDVNGDVDGFLDRMKRIQGVARRLNLPATGALAAVGAGCEAPSECRDCSLIARPASDAGSGIRGIISLLNCEIWGQPLLSSKLWLPGSAAP